MAVGAVDFVGVGVVVVVVVVDDDDDDDELGDVVACPVIVETAEVYDIVLVVAEEDPSSVFVSVFVFVLVSVSPSTEAPFVTTALAETSGQSSTYVVCFPSPSPSALEETPLTVVLLVGNCSETPPSALETTRIVTVTTLSSSPFVLVVAMTEEEEVEEEEAKEVNAVAGGGGVAVELA